MSTTRPEDPPAPTSSAANEPTQPSRRGGSRSESPTSPSIATPEVGRYSYQGVREREAAPETFQDVLVITAEGARRRLSFEERTLPRRLVLTREDSALLEATEMFRRDCQWKPSLRQWALQVGEQWTTTATCEVTNEEGHFVTRRSERTSVRSTARRMVLGKERDVVVVDRVVTDRTRGDVRGMEMPEVHREERVAETFVPELGLVAHAVYDFDLGDSSGSARRERLELTIRAKR